MVGQTEELHSKRLGRDLATGQSRIRVVSEHLMDQAQIVFPKNRIVSISKHARSLDGSKPRQAPIERAARSEYCNALTLYF